ncbi:MAG: hypothetical protein QNJ14_04715 [Woeseiaceae bacterium]|nr:hypothetical protein [Woeseiaceae bacterium]
MLRHCNPLRVFLFGLTAAAFLAGCGGEAPEPPIDHTSSQGQAASQLTAGMTICDCANNLIASGEKARFCTELMTTMDPNEFVTQTMNCRKSMPVPEGGPDTCFCLKTMTEEPDMRATCKDLLETETERRGLDEVLLSCSK